MRFFDCFRKNKSKKVHQKETVINHQTESSPPHTNTYLRNTEAFKDTLRRIEQDPLLHKRAAQSAEMTVVYPSHTVSEKSPSRNGAILLVREATTLQAAKELCRKYRRVAVLNFANPIEPGGGVFRGANAQEESLCRAGTLYPCLAGKNADKYYRHHQEMPHSDSVFWSTDCLVYSPEVTFFKEEIPLDPFSDHPKLELHYTSDWFTADVITCAAPCFFSRQALIPEEELKNVLIGRIQNILESAIEHDVEALVLGAFGCGAFHNPPMVVADAFRSVFLQPRYRKAFSEVWFAIKRSDRFFCPNIEAFEIKLSAFPEEKQFSEERNKRRFFE